MELEEVLEKLEFNSKMEIRTKEATILRLQKELGSKDIEMERHKSESKLKDIEIQQLLERKNIYNELEIERHKSESKLKDIEIQQLERKNIYNELEIERLKKQLEKRDIEKTSTIGSAKISGENKQSVQKQLIMLENKTSSSGVGNKSFVKDKVESISVEENKLYEQIVGKIGEERLTIGAKAKLQDALLCVSAELGDYQKITAIDFQEGHSQTKNAINTTSSQIKTNPVKTGGKSKDNIRSKSKPDVNPKYK